MFGQKYCFCRFLLYKSFIFLVCNLSLPWLKARNAGSSGDVALSNGLNVVENEFFAGRNLWFIGRK